MRISDELKKQVKEVNKISNEITKIRQNVNSNLPGLKRVEDDLRPITNWGILNEGDKICHNSWFDKDNYKSMYWTFTGWSIEGSYTEFQAKSANGNKQKSNAYTEGWYYYPEEWELKPYKTELPLHIATTAENLENPEVEPNKDGNFEVKFLTKEHKEEFDKLYQEQSKLLLVKLMDKHSKDVSYIEDDIERVKAYNEQKQNVVKEWQSKLSVLFSALYSNYLAEYGEAFENLAVKGQNKEVDYE